eukprot:600451-Rhodomonas_salina.1
MCIRDRPVTAPESEAEGSRTSNSTRGPNAAWTDKVARAPGSLCWVFKLPRQGAHVPAEPELTETSIMIRS